MTLRGTAMLMTADFSPEALGARRQWNGISQNQKRKKKKPVNTEFFSQWKYPSIIKVKKTFWDKLKLREFAASRQIVQEVLAEILQVESK